MKYFHWEGLREGVESLPFVSQTMLTVLDSVSEFNSVSLFVAQTRSVCS